MQLTHWNKCTNTFNAFRLPVIEKLRSRIMFQISQTSFISRLQFTLMSPLSKAYGITRCGNPLIVPLALHPQPFQWAQLQPKPESTTLAFNVPGMCLSHTSDGQSLEVDRSRKICGDDFSGGDDAEINLATEERSTASTQCFTQASESYYPTKL